MNGTNMELIKSYFPTLSKNKLEQIEALGALYKEWNAKINLVSRKDIDQIYDHHILHSLAIYKYLKFTPETHILDLGTGGGLPGLPLAICNPSSKFHLVDARAKKIMVVNDMIDQLHLENVKATHIRAEDLKSTYDFIVSRAVAPVKQLLEWSERLISSRQINAVPNGFILLKGGDVVRELKSAKAFSRSDVEEVSDYFQEEYFLEKKIIHIQK